MNEVKTAETGAEDPTTAADAAHDGQDGAFVHDGHLMRPTSTNVGAVQGELGLQLVPIPTSSFQGINKPQAPRFTLDMDSLEARLGRKINELSKGHDLATK